MKLRFRDKADTKVIGSWDLVLFLFLSFSCMVASATYRRAEFYVFDVIILEVSQIAIDFQKP